MSTTVSFKVKNFSVVFMIRTRKEPRRSERGRRGTASSTNIKPKSTSLGSKKTKIQARIKSLEEKLTQYEKQLSVWDKKWAENYAECKKKGIVNAVTYGIIGDYDYLNKIKEPAVRQMVLRHMARQNEINRKRRAIHDKMYPLKHEIYYLEQELKKLR